MKTLALALLISIRCNGYNINFTKPEYQFNLSKNEKPLKDEVLLTYISTDFYIRYNFVDNTSYIVWDPVLSIKINFQCIDYKTKRLGIVRYDKYGNPINELVPIFVSKKEFSRHQLNR